MRRSAVLGPWLPVLLSATVILIKSTHATSEKKYLVCVDPKLQRCITWLTDIEEALEMAKNVYINRDITHHCGLSDLVPVPPHRKYITIISKGEKTERLIFCNVDVLEGIYKSKELHRARRQTGAHPRGRYRGQTQSQYLAIDRGSGKDDGKAEAHSAADSSRASVSGSSGMGQAQSQTMYDPTCDDCLQRSDTEAANLKHGPYITQQTGMPGETSGISNHPPSGGTEHIASNKPGGYGVGQARPTDPGEYRLPQIGVPESNGHFSPPQQGMIPEVSSNGYEPNKGGPEGIFYIPRQNGADSSRPGSGGYISNGSPGRGIHINNDFNPAAQGQPSSGSYGSNTNGIPREDGMFSTSQSGVPGGHFIPGINGSPAGTLRPDTGNGIYGPGHDGTQGGGRNNGNGVEGRQNIPGGVNSALPTGNNGFRQVSYSPPGDDRHSAGLDVYNPLQSTIPNNGIPYGPPRILDGNNPFGRNLPLGIGGYNSPSNTRSFQAPDGTTYYCCVAGPNNNPQYYKTGGDHGIQAPLPISRGSESPSGPNNLMASPIYNTGNGGTTIPERDRGQFSLGGPGYVQSGYQTPGDTSGTTVNGGTMIPERNGGQSGRPGYVQTSYHIPGDSNGLRGQDRLYPLNTDKLNEPIGLTDQSGMLIPRTQYNPENLGGRNGFPTGEQYGPRGPIRSNDQQNQGVPYSPMTTDTQTRLHEPQEQYGSGGIRFPNGQQTTGTDYVPGPFNSIRGQSGLPGGQYNPGATGGQSVLPGTNAQYNPIVTGGFQTGFPGIGMNYDPGSSGTNSGQAGTIGQYNPAATGSPSRLPYGPGVTGSPTGLSGAGGQYGIPGGLSSIPNTNGQYGTGATGGPSRLPGTSGQFVPGTMNSQSGLPESNGQYGNRPSGGSSALPNVNGQYAPGSTVGQSGLPVDHSRYSPDGVGNRYSPGNTGGTLSVPGINTQTGIHEPGSESIVGETNGQNGLPGQGVNYGTGGMYLPGVQKGQQGPTGPYNPGNSGDQVGPNRLYGTGEIGGGQNGLPNQSGQYVPNGSNGQYGPGATGGQNALQGPGGNRNSRPGSAGGGYEYNGNDPYGYDSHGNPIQTGNYNGVPQNVIDPNAVAIDGEDSEAEASVTQGGNGTVATASSKGGNEKGRAQTHVHGAYTGSGSFSAQAEISGENKAANSEVTGDKKGASSQAQGSGRNNKSQANVQLGSETGSVLTGSQSEGVMHSSNTQVQGSIKGGMADAQARGPGSTSSQAQIGFTPYKEGDKLNEQQSKPFVGGGTAQAQSSGRTGSSQSQLRGSFKYGITYNGAAQAGASLDKDAVFPNRLPFDKIDVFDENNKNINVNIETTSQPEEVPPTEESVTDKLPIPGDINEIVPSSETPFEVKLGADEVHEEVEEHKPEDIYGSHTHSDHHKDSLVPNSSHPPAEGRRSFQSNYNNNNADYDYGSEKDDHAPEEYDVDGYGTEGGEPGEVDQYNEFLKDPETHQSLQIPRRKGLEVRQTTGGNTQHIVLGSLNEHDAEITQRNSEHPDETKVYQPGERVPGTGGYTIPIGFTGSVKSVASKENTYVVGTKDSPSQAQTVSLTPGSGKVKYTYPATQTRNISPKDLRSLYNPKADDNRYISVSKSVTRDLDSENNIRKQYSHTYYTKSSSCGYFTFTCTMVSSAEGRKKVCKPKIPTNPDGTPMRC